MFTNAAFAAIIRRADGLSLDRNGRLNAASADARRRLGLLIDDVARGGAGGIVTVPRPGVALPYAVLVARSPSRSVHGSFTKGTSPAVAILVHDPDSRSSAPEEILAKGLGLTRSASRLVAALAGDHDLRSFAETEGVTIHTARFHLRTALSRTGARTQAELVRLAVRLLRDIDLKPV